MDYKYIEQLLERYFECETSLGEEQVLRAFFSQEDVPVRLLQYRQLFAEKQVAQQEEVLSDAFDKRILSLLHEDKEEKPLRVKARIVSMQRRLRPLYKAAACVAVVLAIGQAAQMPYSDARMEQENIARSLEKPAIRQDENAVAKSDSAAKAQPEMPVTVAN